MGTFYNELGEIRPRPGSITEALHNFPDLALSVTIQLSELLRPLLVHVSIPRTVLTQWSKESLRSRQRPYKKFANFLEQTKNISIININCLVHYFDILVV